MLGAPNTRLLSIALHFGPANNQKKKEKEDQITCQTILGNKFRTRDEGKPSATVTSNGDHDSPGRIIWLLLLGWQVGRLHFKFDKEEDWKGTCQNQKEKTNWQKERKGKEGRKDKRNHKLHFGKTMQTMSEAMRDRKGHLLLWQ